MPYRREKMGKERHAKRAAFCKLALVQAALLLEYCHRPDLGPEELSPHGSIVSLCRFEAIDAEICRSLPPPTRCLQAADSCTSVRGYLGIIGQ